MTLVSAKSLSVEQNLRRLPDREIFFAALLGRFVLPKQPLIWASQRGTTCGGVLIRYTHLSAEDLVGRLG